MRIALGCDHGGYLLKESIKAYLLNKGYEVIDEGTNSMDSCDYPFYAHAAAKKVAIKECEFGIVVCTTGEGVCMSANKEKGVRCGLVYNSDVARLIRQHNNANMMALGAKYVSFEEAKQYIDLFLSTEFEGGRHIARVEKIEN